MLNYIKCIKKIFIFIALNGLLCSTAHGMRSIFINCFSARSMPKPVLPVKFQALTSSLISSLVRIYFFNKNPKPIVALPKYKALQVKSEILSLQLSGHLFNDLFFPLLCKASRILIPLLPVDWPMSQEKVNERASQEGDVEKLEELRQRTARIHQLYEKRYGTTLPLIYSFKISNSPNGVASCNFSIIERNFFPNRVTRILSNKCTIVVNDEFFNLPDADKDAILAHEIGHRISAYAPKNLYRFEWYCLINRVISHEKIDGIPLLLIIPQLYRNYCARQLEFEADRQAVLAIGSIAGLKSHLSIHKDVELGWFILLFLTHPTEKDRISALEKIEREELPEQKQQVQEDIQKQHYPQEEVD